MTNNSLNPMAGPQLLSNEIDQLLEHYLALLDQYTTLRGQLSAAQASIQQNIARANFTADRGIRYGQDCYDGRMQATRRCQVSEEGAVVRHLNEEMVSMEASTREKDEEDDDSENLGEDITSSDRQPSSSPNKTKDPIRMFGILTPQALRAAQVEAVKLVEDMIPRILSVDAEMARTEIEIRRKRKYKAKAEAKQLLDESQRVTLK